MKIKTENAHDKISIPNTTTVYNIRVKSVVFICFPIRCNRNQKDTQQKEEEKKTHRTKYHHQRFMDLHSSSVVNFIRFNVDYKIKISLQTSVHLSSFI